MSILFFEKKKKKKKEKAGPVIGPLIQKACTLGLCSILANITSNDERGDWTQTFLMAQNSKVAFIFMQEKICEHKHRPTLAKPRVTEGLSLENATAN